MASEGNEKCFSFTWNIENMSNCSKKFDNAITSPPFVVDDLGGTQWIIKVYARESKKMSKESLGVYLCRKKDDSPVANMQVKYEIAFIGKDGSVLVSETLTSNFEKGVGHGFPAFVKQEEVFDTKRSIFLPQDILTVRCRMWKNCESMLQDVRCFARTRIGFENRSFLWNLENFSTLELEKKCSYLIKSLQDDASMVSIDFFVTEGVNSDEIIRFELSLQDRATEFFTFRLSLVDASGNKILCNQEEFWFDWKNRWESESESDSECKIEWEAKNQNAWETENEIEKFSFFFTRQELLANKKVFLPNDILSLHWDCSFSKEISTDGIEEVQYGCPRTESKISDAHEGNNDKISHLNYLTEKVKHFYDKKFLCDVRLKTSTTTFQAHKVILSASSSAFETLFSSSMEDEGSDCVNFENLNDDTVRRMLHYIYTSRVDDLTWESATGLYDAANKYAILGLKHICFSYLKNNFSTSNALEALLFADKQADCDLKAAVLDYIGKHGKEMENSGWRHLMNANGKLAAEALYQLFFEN
ncbi:Protein roadkill [Araneus ventricosus]|uniref:Protein roadkill n=1 Tax=Araneus ventricosus TaxID=182803 RepID=A0A4Y2CK48_ARAVE|nr:Protein roadkill [Araneus ventricosus]